GGRQRDDPGPLMRAVHWVTDTAARRRGCLAITLATILGAAWWLMPPAEYLPEGEEPKAFTVMTAPPGYNLAEMSAITDDFLELLSAAVGADPALFDRGELRVPALQYYSLRVSPGS